MFRFVTFSRRIQYSGLETMNSRFSLAVHLLCLMAQTPDDRLTSEYMAISTGTNAVVVRRLLATLRRAGLVTARRAGGGGWQLARPATEVSLSAVHQAVVQPETPRMHRNEPHPDCPVGREVRHALSGIYRLADEAIDRELEPHTIAALLDEILSQNPSAA